MDSSARNTRKKKTLATRSTTGILLYAVGTDGLGAAYAKEHPFCEKCFERGIIVPVEEVHHIVPLSEGGTHARDNLISLCKSCHSRIHAERGDRWHNKHD